jgi:hypothetical protein
MKIVSYGGGVNSTALLCLAKEMGAKIDAIVFSDTGSEMPHTYDYIEIMNQWLLTNGMPPITVIKWIRVKGELAGKFLSLHEWCEQNKTVPSRAFGYSGCTTKWKQQPLEKHIESLPGVRSTHASGERVERWLGYDASEPERAERMLAKNVKPDIWHWRAPLFEQDIDRDGCLDLITRSGLPNPGKSSCWMCPSMRKRDIDELGRRYPHLLQRALSMEASTTFDSRGGLGGRLNWGKYVASREGTEPEEQACGCYDGEPE